MNQHAELELYLFRVEQDCYGLELRYYQADGDTDTRLLKTVPTVRFSFEQLSATRHDPLAYGRLLAEDLFRDEVVRTALSDLLAGAIAEDIKLIIRLFIGGNTDELNHLLWECLWAPDATGPLFTGTRVCFSRYQAGTDWRPIKMKARGELRARTAIAGPDNLSDYQLPPMDVATEWAIIEPALQGIPHLPPETNRVTLNALRDLLGDGADIFWLTCHASLVRDECRLWLENDEGLVERIPSRELVALLHGMERLPRLVVLHMGSQSSEGAQKTLAVLGPRLAEGGIPLVLCLPGPISQATMAVFFPTFFSSLKRDGHVETAMAQARAAVANRPDWHIPTLYTRLKSGRMWYHPGFSEDRMQKWPALARHLRRGRGTPILGPGLADHLFGTRQAIARAWAETYHFPMATHQFEDLPRVAQFLAINQDAMFPYEELNEALERELDHRHPPAAELSGADFEEKLEAVLAIMPPTDPYAILARLDLPIYISADPTPVLELALRAAGRRPRLAFCTWRQDLSDLESVFDEDPDYQPNVENPLVFKLFGCLDEPDSMVLTKDDYLDFLLGVTGESDAIPPVVQRALADTALLFLGFRLNTWDFRVLFRGVMRCEGRARRRKYAHVGVQMDPEEMEISDPIRTRTYLESYFGDANISIYWGGPEDFLNELNEYHGEHQ